MRKKLTLTIDGDVYDELQMLSRRISVSEFVSGLLRILVQESNRNRMDGGELFEFINNYPGGGRHFKEILIERWGPTIFSIYEKMAMATGESFKKAEKPEGKKKK